MDQAELKTQENSGEKNGKHKRFAFILLSLFAILILLRLFVFDINSISGNSMSPTLLKGDLILTEKTGRLFGMPGRGSIILYSPPGEKKTKYVKRLVALPGDTIEIEHGKVRVNGKELDIPFSQMERPESIPEYRLSSDEMFVLGENLDKSADSRFHGPVKVENYIGRMIFRFWPLSRDSKD